MQPTTSNKPAHVQQPQTTLIRRKEVERLTALSRSRIYDLMRQGAFPRPVSLGAMSVAWQEVEIHEWIAARIADSRKAKVIATIIGRKVGIRPMKHNDWTVIPNLWGAVVGNSGVMKSPTLAAALSPIKKLQAAAFDEFNEAKVEHDAQAKFAKLQQSANKSNALASLKKDKSADVKGLLQSSSTADSPILVRYITNNASYEALGELTLPL